MYAILQKGGKDALMTKWMFGCVADACFNNDAEPSRFSYDELTGRKKHGRGLTALFLLKMQTRDYLLSVGASMGLNAEALLISRNGNSRFL